jgi:hypothetical protein
MPNMPDVPDAHLKLATGELGEVLRDLCFSMLMPETGARVQKIAGCIAGADRALDRLRYGVLKQERPPSVDA